MVVALRQRGVRLVAVSKAPGEAAPESETWLSRAIYEDPMRLADAMRGCDALVHLAAHAHQTRRTTAEDRALFQSVNVELTKRLYRAAEDVGVAHFLFVSSIGAISSMSDDLINESTAPNPSNDYGRSKLEAEQQLRKISAGCGTAITIIRPCLIYGRGNPGNLARLATAIDRKIPLPVGSIRNRRSFAYIDSVTGFILQALCNPKALGEDFNVADDEFLSTADICQSIATAKGKKAFIVKAPVGFLRVVGRIGDFAGRLAGRSFGIDSYSIERLTGSLPCSNRKAREHIGWRPALPSSQAIEAAFR